MYSPNAHLVSIEETEEHLRLHWRFTALMPIEQARQRLQDYFALLGYTPVASESNTLTMQRGSETWVLDAWELVEAEQYLHGEPVNLEAMKRFNHNLRMQAFRAFARGFATGLLLAALAGLILYPMLTGMGIGKWLLKAIVGAVMNIIVFWQVARAMRLTLGSRKR
jgi:hypothetical protein